VTVYKRICLPARIAHLTASGAACLVLAACASGNMIASTDHDHDAAIDARPNAQAAKTAKQLAICDHGLARVNVEHVGRAPPQDADTRQATSIA
jgi:hypothetical protein